MNPYHRPVIPLLFSFASGILLSVLFQAVLFQGQLMAAFAVIGVCFCVITRAIMARKPSAFAPILLFIALGYASIHPWLSPEFPPNHVARFADGKIKKITGVIQKMKPGVKNGKKKSYRASFILNAESIEQSAPKIQWKNGQKIQENPKKTPVSGQIRVTLYNGAGAFSSGDRVFFYSKIFPIRNFKNPGGFDYKQHMAFKKIWASSYVSSKKMTLEKKGSPSGLGAGIESCRQNIARFIDGKTTGDGAETSDIEKTAIRGILKAMVMGDRTGITPHIREVFNRSGSGHLLAISGLHIGIIATLSFFLLAWLMAFIRPLAMAGGVKKTAAILSLFPVMAYAAISGLSPSTQRAAIMAALFLLSLPAGRLHESFNTLALAAFGMLIIAPYSLFSVSFQLSFAAVFSILYGLNKIKRPPPVHEAPADTALTWSDKLSEWLSKLSRAFYSVFFISLCAIIGTLPFSMFYFNQISLAGIVANCLIVPAVGFIVVPLGLFSSALSLSGLFGADFFLSAALFVMARAFDALEYLSGFSFAAIKTVGLSYFEIVCYFALALSAAHLFSVCKKSVDDENGHGHNHRPNHKKERQKRLTKASAFFAVAVLISCADVAFWVYDRFINPNLRVTFMDVGQGNSALIEFPKGFRAIVDGGGMRSTSDFDTGKNIVAPFLWRKKIKTIDAILLSHPDNDHVKGLVYIAEHFNVKSIWTNNEKSGSMPYRKLMKIARKKQIPTPDFSELPKTQVIHGVTLEVLYPPIDFLKRKKIEKWRDTNNNSMVVKASMGSASILFPGDIMAKGEQELMRLTGKKPMSQKKSDEKLKSSILLAPHHGSKTSSTARFLKKVAPDTIIISSGRKYGRNFPHARTMKKYRKQGAKIFRTDTDGAIQIVTNGKTVATRAKNQSHKSWLPINQIKEAFGLCF